LPEKPQTSCHKPVYHLRREKNR